MKNDDVALIQRILAGDEAALASLIRKYQKQVHTYALRKIGDYHTAEDITQETFLRVYQNLEYFRQTFRQIFPFKPAFSKLCTLFFLFASLYNEGNG